MNKAGERLINGLVKENPTFVLMLGMCPTLAVTTSAINGLGMGLTTMVVLALSNVIISLLRNIIPDKVRIPAFIVIIATIALLLSETFLKEEMLSSDLASFYTVSFMDVIFEVISAFGTVGLTLGITSNLSLLGKIIIILLMIIGRLRTNNNINCFI